MLRKLKYSLFLLEDEFSRIENRLNREIAALEKEYAIEKRPTRRRAIKEEIENLNSKFSPEYQIRAQKWRDNPEERFDKHGWYRCPRCWLEHSRLSETKCSDSKFEGFECGVKGCSFFALTPEGLEEQEEASKQHQRSPSYG